MAMMWYPVPGYPGVFANRDGQIGKQSGDEIINAKLHTNNGTGYVYCHVQGKTVQSHILVCSAFYGYRPTKKHQVNHKNKDRGDNRPGNLEWVTNTENQKHARDTEGTAWKSYVVPERRLTEDQVKALIADQGYYSMTELSIKYEVPEYFVKQLLWAANKGKRKPLRKYYGG